ncbi:MAG: DUF3857 domain-containing protein [Nonlabens sp.]|nr:DUF3857 domain-containing protein [Nonlabens sp.]
MKVITTTLCILFSFLAFAQQDLSKSVSSIPQELSLKTDAVIRNYDILVTVEAEDRVFIRTEKLVTVYNESGISDLNAVEYYNKNRQVKELEVIIYDALGNKLERIKKGDFKDISAVDGGTLYQDDRALALEYFPLKYPLTFHFTSEVLLKSTAFLPTWTPISAYRQSLEMAKFKLVNNSSIEVKVKKMNFENFPVKELSPLSYEMSSYPAIPYDSYALGLDKLVPTVKFALEKFNMEGVDGVNTDWLSFGKWMYTSLLQETKELPQEVKQEIKALTVTAKTEREKAEIVYAYMQNRSRYISVQVGIGGWKPIDAASVHKTAYGDCKGLSNYTHALLEEVGVNSQYTVIFGGSKLRDIDKDFSSTQGNHVILHLPNLDGKEDVWLECTSKNSPFGFIAGFTDDRDALVVTKTGGVIKHTTSYPAASNIQNTSATVNLNENGDMAAVFKMESTGYQYTFREDLENMSSKERIASYKRRWSYINDLKVEITDYKRDREEIVVKEKLNLSTTKYASKSGNMLIFQPVIFNRNIGIPEKSENRLQGFEVSRGYKDVDAYAITLPDGFKIDASPEPKTINSVFGNYELRVLSDDNGVLQVSRTLLMNKGTYTKEQFEDFRRFQIEIANADKSKVVIIKS